VLCVGKLFSKPGTSDKAGHAAQRVAHLFPQSMLLQLCSWDSPSATSHKIRELRLKLVAWESADLLSQVACEN
jgi:hypothetical protein